MWHCVIAIKQLDCDISNERVVEQAVERKEGDLPTIVSDRTHLTS